MTRPPKRGSSFKRADEPKGNDDNEELVRALYIGLLEREPDPAGLQNYIGHLTNGVLSKSDLVREIRNSEEFRQKFSRLLNE